MVKNFFASTLKIVLTYEVKITNLDFTKQFQKGQSPFQTTKIGLLKSEFLEQMWNWIIN
jgi:hypothetical protein